jgi:hypothetical protein
MHGRLGTRRSGDEIREGKTGGVTNNNSGLFGHYQEARVKGADPKTSGTSMTSTVRKVTETGEETGENLMYRKMEGESHRS